MIERVHSFAFVTRIGDERAQPCVVEVGVVVHTWFVVEPSHYAISPAAHEVVRDGQPAVSCGMTLIRRQLL